MSRAPKLFILAAISLAMYWTLPMVWGADSASVGKEWVVEETLSPNTSEHPKWWVESGAMLVGDEMLWKTNQGSLPTDDKWRKHYLRANPLDTDNGYHPQNIFRMFWKGISKDPVQELRFSIERTNLSESPNRNARSGIFLYSRYINESNYYYAGIQADGQAVIRKKFDGTFKDLALVPVFAGQYDRDENPSLIPHHENLGLKVETAEMDGALHIKVSIAQGSDEWRMVAEAVDTGRIHGRVLGAGRTGVRTDFMDVLFTSYSLKESPGQAANWQ